MYRLCFAMSFMLVIGSMSALGGPQIPQEVTDQIHRKANELMDAGFAVSVGQSNSPGLFLYQRNPNENLAKAIDMLKDFPHPLNIDLAIWQVKLVFMEDVRLEPREQMACRRVRGKSLSLRLYSSLF